MGDIVDEIDALVDDQMAGGEHVAAAAPSVPLHCPLCWRDWHGLAITQRMEEMRVEYALRDDDEDGETDYAESAILDGYRYDLDESRVLCPGPGYLGPLPEWAMCQCRSCWYRRLMQTWSFDDVFDPTSWGISVGHLRTASALDTFRAQMWLPAVDDAPYLQGPVLHEGDRVGVEIPGAGVLVGRFHQTETGFTVVEDTEQAVYAPPIAPARFAVLASLRARLHQLTRGWV